MMVGRRGRGLAEEGGKVVRAMEGIERENDAINHRKTAGQSGGELCLSTSSQRNGVSEGGRRETQTKRVSCPRRAQALISMLF